MICTKRLVLAAAITASQVIALSAARAASHYMTLSSARFEVSCRRTARGTLALLLLFCIIQPSKVLAAPDSLQLYWTAPGDDNNVGQPYEYDLRYSTSVIVAGNFSSATRFLDTPVPAAACATETCEVTGLNSGTPYYFCIKTSDESGNWSEISNVVTLSSDAYLCCDADRIIIVYISDVVYLSACIFSGGLAPNPLATGDASCYSTVDISDVVCLISHVFSGGLAPCAACT